MELNHNFQKLFPEKALIGMLHLGGKDPLLQAKEELEIFEACGFAGAIVENYFSDVETVRKVLKEISTIRKTIALGLNILPNDVDTAFSLAEKYRADFIQFDHVAGEYEYRTSLDEELYSYYKRKLSHIVVLGGVWPKYYTPKAQSSLQEDIRTASRRAEAVVVTGSGTGSETPINKIEAFREILGDHPLVIGAGITTQNIQRQMCLADAAIVGTALKYEGKTEQKVDTERVQALVTKLYKNKE